MDVGLSAGILAAGPDHSAYSLLPLGTSPGLNEVPSRYEVPSTFPTRRRHFPSKPNRA